ncbi:HELP domain protein (macronuclear) [Tetrahymena thermophila SB210]|uniref:HELP domain protein n=1 Tax=Tetrahymena thermophila (strain SB210) TaxID=312017 RepID=Q23D99_TETTS|nr:HELP domain protein [Tetrahymena thermophila SB210]EAR94433.2 HELP domain protein [Tetrahymena thermophila SB210]|eukprot:XP_001014787.2 HELP domain protein [Tetrahymena thermophila SB210]
MGCGTSTGNNQVKEPDAYEGGEVDEDLELEFGKTKLDKAGNQINKYETKDQKPEEDNGLFELENNPEAEKFMAVKPWIGALKAPSNPPQIDPSAPSTKLQLEYINGYKCEDCRSNLYYTCDQGKVVYFSAAVGIVLDINANKQEFFGAGQVGEIEGHNDDIESLDICPQRKLVVTGQRGPNPLVLVWNCQTMEIVARLQLGRGNRAAKCVKFSKDGKQVFVTDEHNDHNVHVFDIATQQKIASNKTGGDPIMDMDTSNGTYKCAVAGKRGLIFFETGPGFINSSKGLYGATERVDMLSIKFFEDGNRCISGSINGSIYIWNGKQASKMIRAHQGAIHVINIVSNQIFSSGAKDKKLKVFDATTLTQKQEYDLPNYAKAIDYSNDQILVGTRNGQILQISQNDVKTLMNGHFTGETWGLDVDIATGKVISTGDDNKIIVFDPVKNTVEAEGIVNPQAGAKPKIGGASTLSLYPPNQCSRAVAINPLNGHIAIASNYGDLSIRKGIKNINDKIFEQRISNEWIEVLQYSPNGQFLAVGSHDNNIYIFNVNDNYTKTAVCKGHQSFITSLDWSRDGQFIQSNCGAYEYLFFNAMDGQQLTAGASQLRDEKWQTFTCKIGWPVQGVFPPCTDGSHVNGVSRSHDESIISTSDDWGFVNLYRNPCLKSHKALSYRAHSSHVVRVKFDKNDQYLYSVGGYDKCLMKWKLIH